MNKRRKKKIKLGDVYAIPLPDERYGFGRVFKDSCIAIYKHIGNDLEDTPKQEDYKFIVGIYDYPLQNGEWAVVENRPFLNDEDSWPPPQCIIDPIDGSYSIYYKGEIMNSNKEQCEGLEEAAVWGDNHIIDRIMGDDTWHKR
jgi:hypothetical protein